MTQHPSPPLGGDEAKVEPVAWRWKLPHHDTGWTYTDDDPGPPNRYLTVQPLYAAPVLPVEVREKIVAELDQLIKHIVAIGPEKPKLKGTDREYEIPMARRVWREVAADAILSTIKGDA